MKNNIKIGRIGEEIARDYLEDKGYDIIEQNCKTRYSEIDLIAKKDDVLVFIEVRTKTSERFGSPEETINKEKIRRLIRSADAYSAIKRWKGQYRIDAVCVVLDQNHKLSRIQHYESIT
ncbi:YraN family protein [Candidatus Parcubacteria bacterium]|nr:YraN family protein [Candidatus Parcubacteria bacterium]